MTRLSLIIGCILISVQSFSQVDWGFKGGFNLSNILEKGNPSSGLGPTEETGTNLGLHLGFMASIKIAERFSFQPEIQFSQKGVRNKTRGINFTLNYLEIPLMVSVTTLKRLNVEFGPSPSFLISDSAYKLFDFGLSAGLQGKISNNFGLIVRYTHGLTTIATIHVVDVNGNIVNEYGEYNRCLQFGIVYKLKSE